MSGHCVSSEEPRPDPGGHGSGRGSVQALGGVPPPGPTGRTAEGNLLEPTTGGRGRGDVCEGRRLPSGSRLLIGGCASQRYCFTALDPSCDSCPEPYAALRRPRRSHSRQEGRRAVCVCGGGGRVGVGVRGASPVAPPPNLFILASKRFVSAWRWRPRSLPL